MCANFFIKDNMQNIADNSISTKELFSEYNWFQETFSSVIQNASDDFFTQFFDINFIGLSKNINFLQGKEACFVTKANVDKDYDVYFRLTETSVKIILDRVLGKSNSKFRINSISEIEAKIITTFNAEIFRDIKNKLSPHDPKELKRGNFDTINLIYSIKDRDAESKTAGKIFVSLPAALLMPDTVHSSGEKFTKSDFSSSYVKGKIFVGSMKSSLYDVKNLDVGDVVVLDDSNIESLKLYIGDTVLDVHIKSNMDIIIANEDENINIEGENNMAETHNLWDSIEVDMNAEFDSVKITLGELKNIEEGLVVDLASLYKNNITLKVENKPIATGSLVIVNDRYGVKINNVIAGANAGAQAPGQNNEEPSDENFEQEQNYNEGESGEEEYGEEELGETEGEGVEENEEGEEDFDYSDFELEDENL